MQNGNLPGGFIWKQTIPCNAVRLLLNDQVGYSKTHFERTAEEARNLSLEVDELAT